MKNALLTLLLACAALAAAAPASAAPDPDAPWTVVVASTAYQAAGNIKELVAQLGRDQKKKDASAFARTRLLLLENIALLQDWALRLDDPSTYQDALPSVLTEEGRKALGTRKPKESDFAPRPGVARQAPKGTLDFKP